MTQGWLLNGLLMNSTDWKRVLPIMPMNQVS
uniref:Uncharacterized protein n=1 Tax=Medicago truncatula TaxID=3880 RepID=I3SJX1_MEDTR|nr:unknown [Medicago truncatula]